MPSTTLNRPKPTPVRQRRAWLPTLGWATVAVFSVAIAAGSARYFLPHPPFPAEILRTRIAAHDPWLLTHIVGGVFALATGPFQFSRQLRIRHLTLHRWIGYVYLVAIALGSFAGFRIALESFGGVSAHFGFGMLAILWLITTAMAYRRILQRRIQSHREWMIRSFALTFAAVTLRLWIPLFVGGMRIDFLPAYQTISWLCWVPNLIVAELLVNNSRHRPAIL
jgi:hypothetical protein